MASSYLFFSVIFVNLDVENVVGDSFGTDIVKFVIGDFLLPVVNCFTVPVFLDIRYVWERCW